MRRGQNCSNGRQESSTRSSCRTLVEAWKAVFENVKAVQVESEDDDDDRLIADTLVSGGGVPSKGGKMCRKCFSA